ncbi:MAG: molybdopterin molybdenumtransferase MoeA, partial [Ignavibacteria bacterium]|nr:molybdopterin molybdenumtransferase MoeA [Ignavibacteria bacterium]
DNKRHFLLGKFEIIDANVFVSTDFSQNSGHLFDMSLANCLVVFNETEQKKSKGDVVECIAI